jgi:peroxiredoxin-like protein
MNAKAYDFPLSVRWTGGRRTIASVEGKDDLEVATPPEFKGGVEGVWSPEDLFVGSVAACFTVTLVAVAERSGVPLRELEVSAHGRVTQRHDGRFGFTEVLLDVSVVTDAGFESEIAAAVDAAETGCLVACSIDLPVKVQLEVRAAALLEAAR